MRRILEMLVLLAQTLFYTAGIVVFIYLVMWGNASDQRMQASSERMQASHERQQREHERMILLMDHTLREMPQR